jgi:hypothetical protein
MSRAGNRPVGGCSGWARDGLRNTLIHRHPIVDTPELNRLAGVTTVLADVDDALPLVGHQYAQAGSEGRRLVAFRDAAGIQGALGVDAVGAVLFSGPAAGGHHDAALAAW